MKRLFYIFCSLILGFAPALAHAQFQLFPGEASGANDFRIYIQQFYAFSIGAGILIATVLIMIGGIMWTTSAGNPGRIDKAKGYIIDSIIGVVLLIGAYTILQVVNPNLVNLRLPEFPKIDIALGGCLYTTNNPAGKTGAKCLNTTQTQCESIKKEGSPAPQFNKDQRCSALCPENDVDGFCKNAQKKPTISEDERVVKAAYCGQFSTSIEAVQQRVSDYTRYDEQENCNRYCSSRPLGQTSDGVEFICSSEYVRGEFVNGRQFPSRCNCL